jgi:hypothetical protein
MLARSQANGLLSPASIYLVLLGMFHLGMVVPVEAGLAVLEAPPWWMASPHVKTAIGVFTTAAVAFTLGARAGSSAAPRVEGAGALPPHRELFRVGAAVATVGAGLLWTGAVQLGVLSSGYNTYFERALSQDVRLFGFGFMLFPIGLLIAAVGATRREMVPLGIAVAVVLGPLFLAGFRGPTIVQAAALLAVWARKDRAIARRVALGVVAAAVLLVPAVRVSRDLGQGLAPGFRTLDPIQVLLETGGSLYPLVVTADRLESGKEEPWMGRSYAMAVGRVLPNVALRRSTPGARTLTPSAWATMHADPWAFDHGGGIGFSGVAEPYLNFGTAGVVVFFLLLGLLTRVWERSLGGSPFRAAIGAASFGFLLWTVRNDAMELFRAMAFASATVLAAWFAVRARVRRPHLDRPAAPAGAQAGG